MSLEQLLKNTAFDLHCPDRRLADAALSKFVGEHEPATRVERAARNARLLGRAEPVVWEERVEYWVDFLCYHWMFYERLDGREWAPLLCWRRMVVRWLAIPDDTVAVIVALAVLAVFAGLCGGLIHAFNALTGAR